MLLNILKLCRSNNFIVTLILDETNWEKIIIGSVVSINQKSIILEELNPYGTVLRNKKIDINSIKIVSYQDIYGVDLQLLKSSKENIIPVPKKSSYIYKTKDSNLFLNKLEELQITEEIVSFFIDDNYQIGKVIEFDRTFLRINNITFQGLDDGYTILIIDSITKIRKGGMVEKKVDYLHRTK